MQIKEHTVLKTIAVNSAEWKRVKKERIYLKRIR